MGHTITVRTDAETESALDLLTHDGISRSVAIREAILAAANRLTRATWMRRAVLRVSLGTPDGINISDELSRNREYER